MWVLNWQDKYNTAEHSFLLFFCGRGGGGGIIFWVLFGSINLHKAPPPTPHPPHTHTKCNLLIMLLKQKLGFFAEHFIKDVAASNYPPPQPPPPWLCTTVSAVNIAYTEFLQPPLFSLLVLLPQLSNLQHLLLGLLVRPHLCLLLPVIKWNGHCFQGRHSARCLKCSIKYCPHNMLFHESQIQVIPSYTKIAHSTPKSKGRHGDLTHFVTGRVANCKNQYNNSLY